MYRGKTRKNDREGKLLYICMCLCVYTDIQKGFWQQQRRVNMERATPVLYKYLPVSVAMHYYYRAVEG